MVFRRSWGIACIAAFVAGVLCFWSLRSNENRANGSVTPQALESAGNLLVLPGEHTGDEDRWFETLSKLSGQWISGDGEQRAKLEGCILTFEDAPDWPDLENREFRLGVDLRFLSETGRYWMSGEGDEIAFSKEDRLTKSLSALTLYRKGSPFAAARPPLSRTPPPPSIQSLLDLVPTIREGESLEAVLGRFPKDWAGKLTVIGGGTESRESDIYFDLGVNGEWVLHAKKKVADDKILRFRLFRSYMQDWKGKGPDVTRVVFPYYEFGKVITGPMESHQAGR